jgi:glycosyltransferase involved in cell wall biosynthesis
MDTADVFHANSHAVLDTMRSTAPRELGADRWQVVSLGLADHAFELDDRDRPPAGRRRLFFAGRFETRNGIDTLLDALARILPDHPTSTSCSPG